MECDDLQVIFRVNEFCEKCGAKNPFRKLRTITDGSGDKMQYVRCNKCGASAKVFWKNPEGAYSY